MFCESKTLFIYDVSMCLLSGYSRLPNLLLIGSFVSDKIFTMKTCVSNLYLHDKLF